MDIKIARLSQHLERKHLLWDDAIMRAWPEFMLQDPVADLYFAKERLERCHDFILFAFDEDAPDTVLARAFSVPFCFGASFGRKTLPDGGWDTLVQWADYDALLGRAPNAVSAIEITVREGFQGQGLSHMMVAALRQNAARLGFRDLYAPVRPSHKHLRPELPMQDYAALTREDDFPEDPWLRVHARAGGRIVKVAPYSMVIAGTLQDWRSWTGLPLEASGQVVVPLALAPLHVSLEHDHAVYVEANVWVHHALA